METSRECNLAYLAFENKIHMKDIPFDTFVKLWTSKPRELNI